MNSDRLNLDIFLATMEVSIISTAFVRITDELQAFSNSAWSLTLLRQDLPVRLRSRIKIDC